MANGLGFDSGYGKPLSASFAGAVQTATGLGRMQDEQRARAMAQQMQALWQQSGGDWEKFKAAGGQQFLSPQLVQKMDAEAEARRVQQEQFDAQMLSRGLDRAATVANQKNTLAQRASEADALAEYRQGTLAEQEAERVQRGVKNIQERLHKGAELALEEREFDATGGTNLGAIPRNRTRLEDREKVFEEWDTKQGKYVEVSRGPAAASDLIGGADNPYIRIAAQKVIAGESDFNDYTKRGMSRFALTAAIEDLAPGTNINELRAKFKMRQDAPVNRSVAVLKSIVNPVVGKGGRVDSIIDEFEAAHKELSLTDFPAANAIKLKYLEQTGDPRVTRYFNLRTAIGMEIGQALGAAALTDKRLEVELENLSRSSSPAQAKAIVGVIRDLVEARLSAFEKEQGRPEAKEPAPQGGGNIAPAGVKAKLPDGRVVTSDGKGGWN